MLCGETVAVCFGNRKWDDEIKMDVDTSCVGRTSEAATRRNGARRSQSGRDLKETCRRVLGHVFDASLVPLLHVASH
jgi:hypothetical protein